MSLPNTHFGAPYIENLLKTPKKIFFAGIGGISMCSLAWIAKLRGHLVSGYDRTPTAITKQLSEDGITVYHKADESHVEGIDLLVYTVAMPETNPEYAAALQKGIPAVSRADFLGYVMTSYRNRVGVSGMHGKSTTTSILERIYTLSGRDPVVSCGATMKAVGTPYRIGRGDDFLFEACEYMDSFLDFYPTTAIILNIEMDHVDYFHSMKQITDSFAAFLDRTGPDGTAVVNLDDENVMEAAKNYKGRLITFGVKTDEAMYTAKNIRYEKACPAFDLFFRGEKLTEIKMSVPGSHIVPDALAAAAAAHTDSISPEDIASALAAFGGAERRMDYCGKTAKGAAVYTDYAHHPTEILTTLKTATEMGFGKIYSVFQPHTYSRTNDLFEDFAEALSSVPLEQMMLADIYPARETNIWGVSSEKLAAAIEKRGCLCHAFPDFNQIIDTLLGNAGEGDMILVMGAGDINTIIKNLTV